MHFKFPSHFILIISLNSCRGHPWYFLSEYVLSVCFFQNPRVANLAYSMYYESVSNLLPKFVLMAKLTSQVRRFLSEKNGLTPLLALIPVPAAVISLLIAQRDK